MTAKTKNPLDQGTYEADCSAERIEMTPDLKELERLARAATPGPWFQVGQPWNPNADFVCAGSYDPHIGKYVCDTENFDGDVENSCENAAYIAAANPAVILSLIAELEQAKKDAERYRWLTADHADAEMRDLAEDTGIRLRWIGKGSADAAIDAAIAKDQS